MWPRQNFSLQFWCNIKQTSCENKEIYQLLDKQLIKYQILWTNIQRLVWQTVRRIFYWNFGSRLKLHRILHTWFVPNNSSFIWPPPNSCFRVAFVPANNIFRWGYMNNRHAVVTYKVSLPFLSCVGLRNETGD